MSRNSSSPCDCRQESSSEIFKDRIHTPNGAKLEREVTKDSTRTDENEAYKVHGTPLFCPILTCNRHNGKGFTRQENLKEHMRRQHKEHCNTPKLDRKRKVEEDEKGGFGEIKRLRQGPRDLSSQFTTLNVRLREIMALVQQLQENALGAREKTVPQEL